MPTSDLPAPAATAKPPRCAMCRARIEVVRREPGPNGSEKFSYRCPKCGFSKTKTVGDPMDAGRHRPPRGK